MHNDRNFKLRIFSFLMACTLLLPIDGMTAAAVEDPSTESAQPVQLHEGATVLSQTEEDPDTAVQSYDSATGYIVKESAAALALEQDETSGLSFEDALEQRRQVLAMLQSFLGTPYVYGGAAPGGFDCSGLVYYTYGRLGYELTRCADSQLLYDGTAVASDALQLGDLVFFRDPGSPWVASHVGIYVGDRMMIHASSRGTVYDSIDSYYYASRYVGARRIIDVDTTNITAPGLNTGVTLRDVQ